MFSDGTQRIAELSLNNYFYFSVLKYIDILLFLTATGITKCAIFFQFLKSEPFS